MHFKPKKTNPQTPVTLNQSILELVSSNKNLGLEIDSNLDPSLQWDRVFSNQHKFKSTRAQASS